MEKDGLQHHTHTPDTARWIPSGNKYLSNGIDSLASNSIVGEEAPVSALSDNHTGSPTEYTEQTVLRVRPVWVEVPGEGAPPCQWENSDSD